MPEQNSPNRPLGNMDKPGCVAEDERGMNDEIINLMTTGLPFNRKRRGSGNPRIASGWTGYGAITQFRKHFQHGTVI